MRNLFFIISTALAIAGCEAGPSSPYGTPSLETALWLSGWGVICLLGVAVFCFRSRLIAVREDGNRYREMVEEAGSIIMRSTEDGTILYMNRFALEFFGWTESEIIGQNVYGMLIPETGSDGKSMGFVWALVRNQEDHDEASENENQRKDGSRVWMAWTNKWVPSADGQSREVLSVGTDRTALHEQRLLLKQIQRAAKNAPYCIAITDAEQRIQFVNAYWLEAFGYDNNLEVMGTRVNLFQCSCGNSSRRIDALYKELAQEGFASEVVDCGDSFSRIVVNVMRDSEGVETGYLVVIRDITNEMDAANDLEQAREQAEAAARTKSLILSSVTHEIRTPLNGVMGMLQVLLMGDLSDEQKEQANTAIEAAMDLGAIVDAILMYSEVDSENFALEPQPFSVVSTVLGLLEDYRSEAQEQGLRLDLEADPGTQDGFNGDGRRLRQIIEVLLGNAIKFTSEGSVTVRLATVTKGNEGMARLTLSVEDTGVGIAEDRLPSILTGFVQGDQSYSRRFGGLGLGLGMAGKLAEAMGGKLSVKSREGEGTTVSLTLFLETLDASQGATPLVIAPMLDRGERPRVLLAIGNGLDGLSLKFYLQCRGVDVVSVAGPAQGLVVLEDASKPVFDLAVFHLHGPEERAMLKRLNEEAFTVPVALLGGSPDNTCQLDHVVACATYPIRHEEVWGLLLATVYGE